MRLQSRDINIVFGIIFRPNLYRRKSEMYRHSLIMLIHALLYQPHYLIHQTSITFSAEPLI